MGALEKSRTFLGKNGYRPDNDRQVMHMNRRKHGNSKI